MNLPTFESFKPLKYKWPGIRLLEGTLDVPSPSELIVIGIDPGVNFGITIIADTYVQVIYGKLPKKTRLGWHGIDAYDFIIKALGTVEDETGIFYQHYRGAKAVVEGAAYDKIHGQVGLEEVRFGFFLALHHIGFNVSIVAPRSVRKIAFGSGNTTALDMWPLMNSNAADSIGCALVALHREYNEETQE